MSASSHHGGRAQAKLCIEAAAWEALLAHLRRSPRQEACGLLSGEHEVATRFHAIPNSAARPDRRYEMEPAALIRTLRQLRETGARLLAIVHSHPHGDASPSATDIAEASYPDAVYIIVALRTSQPDVRGFWLQPDREPEPVRIEVMDS